MARGGIFARVHVSVRRPGGRRRDLVRRRGRRRRRRVARAPRGIGRAARGDCAGGCAERGVSEGVRPRAAPSAAQRRRYRRRREEGRHRRWTDGRGGGGAEGPAARGTREKSGGAAVSATLVLACVAALAALAYFGGIDDVVAMTIAPIAQSNVWRSALARARDAPRGAHPFAAKCDAT